MPLAAIEKKELLANWKRNPEQEWQNSSSSTAWDQMDWQSDWQTNYSGYQQNEWSNRGREEGAAERSERRSRDSKERERNGRKGYNTAEEALRERGRIRIQGSKRYEEKQKREKEMEEKTIIQQKKHCVKGRESEYKETKDMKKNRRERRKVEGRRKEI